IYQALTECADLLDHYGGHQAAAGMSLQAERLPELHARLNSLAGDWLSKEDYIPLTDIDIRCTIEECTVDLIEQLEALAPYGIGNRGPRFLLEQADIRQLRKIGKEGQHLKLTLSDHSGGQQLDAVGFGIGELHTQFAPHAKVDVIGELQVNEWNGVRKSQLLIQDIRVNHLQVFDWRGLTPTRSMNEQTQEGRSYPGLRDDAAFVIFDNHESWRRTVTAMFGERSIVLCDDNGRLTSDGHGSEYAQPTDLVLVQIPRSKQQLVRLLESYGDGLQR